MTNKVAMISGITGQDGPYLAKLLLEKGYDVVGLVRADYGVNKKNLEILGIEDKVSLVACNLLDMSNVINTFLKYNPNEFYNLASQSSVGTSFSQPIGTLEFNIISVANILEAIKIVDKNIRFYQASSSEMFGEVESLPITEETAFHPVSPYGISKAAAHWIAVNYREAFGLYTASGILFNHESILRGDNFVIKKIISTLVNVKQGRADRLVVGNIDIKRDFGYAPKYVEAMHLMMQQECGDDYIISSGRSISLRQIIEYVLNKLELDFSVVQIDKTLFRPSEIKDIFGDNQKASNVLGWLYDIPFEQVLDEMLASVLQDER